jgi:hypothetical protein
MTRSSKGVVDGRADDAVRELQALAAVNPDHTLLRQMTLERLAVSLMLTWDLATESLPLLRFAQEIHPESVTLRSLLAEAQQRKR